MLVTDQDDVELAVAWIRVGSKRDSWAGLADIHRFHVAAASRSASKGELGWPQDRIVFFCVRRFVARMGLDRLIKAAAAVRDRGLNFHLYIAGRGPLHAKLESLIRELRLNDRVQLVGALSEPQLAAMYSAADAVVRAA